MTVEQLYGWFLLSLMLIVVLAAAVQIIRGAWWLTKRVRSWYAWHQFVRQHRWPDRIL